MTPQAKLLAVVASALALTGCVSPVAGKSGNYARPIGNAPVTANPTPYSQGLVCLSNYARANNISPPRIAVGRVIDYTGKADDEGGRQITQGASLMAISAFAKAGARLVERFDTSVGELELKYANNKLIGDDSAEAKGQSPGDFRKILAGSIPGSDYYFIGGITELNSNIRTVSADAFVGDVDATDPKGKLGNKLFVINVGVDLRLVDTRTLEVVDVISYQKQVIGREISAGVFAFGNNNIFDIGAGERSLEPLQLAVRSTIERAVLEMTANLYGVANSSSCAGLANDYKGVFKAQSVTGQAVVETGASDASVRANPARWDANRDKGMKATLRGTSTPN
jgi:curli production assembly/transport component CsgG/holdfast attachment protein HfaB